MLENIYIIEKLAIMHEVEIRETVRRGSRIDDTCISTRKFGLIQKIIRMVEPSAIQFRARRWFH